MCKLYCFLRQVPSQIPIYCSQCLGRGFSERQMKALLGFEPRISCLQDRRFHHLSHSTISLKSLWVVSWHFLASSLKKRLPLVCHILAWLGLTYSCTDFRRAQNGWVFLMWCKAMKKEGGTAGIWTQDLLFTRQALWPTKPQRQWCLCFELDSYEVYECERVLSQNDGKVSPLSENELLRSMAPTVT